MDSLREIADDLYSLAPSEFVEARNARAAETAAGDRDRTARIRSFVKPPVAAWAVNALVRIRPDEVDDLLDLGRRMRDASTALDRAALQELGRERQRMLAAIGRSARDLGTELGVPVSEPAVILVQQTFQAALADADAAEAVSSGLLTRPLASSGVDPVDLAGAVALPLRLAAVGGRGATARAPETSGGSADHLGGGNDGDGRSGSGSGSGSSDSGSSGSSDSGSSGSSGSDSGTGSGSSGSDSGTGSGSGSSGSDDDDSDHEGQPAGRSGSPSRTAGGAERRPRAVTRADAEQAAADRAAAREAARAEAKREAEEARQAAEDAANDVADIDLRLRESTERRDELATRVRELRDELEATQDELSELTVQAAALRKERTRAQRASDTAARAAAYARRRADS